MKKLFLYFNTVRYMKPSQIYYRIQRLRKREISIGIEPKECENCVHVLKPIRELDYDRDFIARFNIEEIKSGLVTFLNSSEKFDWNSEWNVKNATPLWNFNLHYFEYLFPFAKEFEDNKSQENIIFANKCISSWINQNPISKKGIGWESYTIALRLTNWIEYYSILEPYFDSSFKERIQESIYEQYVYLSKHLEKDLLGNHYFEDLKTLILCSIFFEDKSMLNVVIDEFKNQCHEQILGDGMHFELSPMYHKIILEDIIRIAYALKNIQKKDNQIECNIQSMLDVAYSLEEGLDRVPLFNDSGNNVSKSLTALLQSAEKYFGIKPRYKNSFVESGYYIYKNDGWKLIVDAGKPGPTYIPGHAHCDAMSFELFKDGRPIIVNCGSYAYQCNERTFFRSTKAHNTVMVEKIEQSECWGEFRLAKRAKVRVLQVNDTNIRIELNDQKNNRVVRTFEMKDNHLKIEDCAKGKITTFFHFNSSSMPDSDSYDILKKNNCVIKADNCTMEYVPYAEIFGEKNMIISISLESKDKNSFFMKLI